MALEAVPQELPMTTDEKETKDPADLKAQFGLAMVLKSVRQSGYNDVDHVEGCWVYQVCAGEPEQSNSFIDFSPLRPSWRVQHEEEK